MKLGNSTSISGIDGKDMYMQCKCKVAFPAFSLRRQNIEWCFVSNGNAYELVLGSLLKRLENMILHFHFVINLED